MKILLTKVLVVATLAVPSILSAEASKGLNVLMTSPDA